MKQDYKMYSVTEPNADRSGYNVHYWIEVNGLFYGKIWEPTDRRLSRIMEYITNGEINGLIGIPYDSCKIKQVR